MDDRRRIPGGEGSPRALCGCDSSTPARGVGVGSVWEVVLATVVIAWRRKTQKSTERWRP